MSKTFPILILSLLGILIYSNTFNSSFHFDDLGYIIDNPDIRTLDNIFAFWDFRYRQTRMIPLYTFALNYHFHQLDVFGYHIINLFIHILSSLMVYWLVFLTFLTPRQKSEEFSHFKNRIALMAALLFLSHPLQTQAVTYLTQRFASLATLFYLLSLCLFIKGRLNSVDKFGLPAAAYFIGAALVGLLGMFSKEIVFTLPFMVILYEFYFFPRREGKKIKLKFIMPVLMFALVVPVLFKFNFAYVFMTERASQSHLGDVVTFQNYWITQCRVIVTYIRLLFIPIGQNLDYDFPLSQSL